MTRLRGINLYFNENFSQYSSVYSFLRQYSKSRQLKKQSLSIITISKISLIIILSLSLIYAMIPGLMRILLFKESFIPEKYWFVTVSALICNFLLVLSVILGIEFEYSQNFGNYKDWMKDVTYLLSREESDKIDMSRLFLSLKKRSNVLGWLELRSFLAIEGQIYFGEQELATLCLILTTICETIFLCFRVYFIRNRNAFESILFIGILCSFFICVLSLMRIGIAGRTFENLQTLQERLIAEQKFFLRCHLAPNNNIKNGKFDFAKAKNEKEKEEQNKQEEKKDDGLDGKEKKDEDEDEDDVNKPLIASKSDNVNRNDESRNDIVAVDEYNLSFLDDMSDIVHKKQILPKLFGIKLTGVLFKTIAGVVLSTTLALLRSFIL